MKKKSYFNEHIDVSCGYCKHGSEFDGAVVCKLGRLLSVDCTCKYFDYDPLKRQPAAMSPLKSFDPNDFKL